AGGFARRLASGRNVANLVQAMERRLFSSRVVTDEPGQMTSSPGLFAYYEGRPVMILKCFTRHRVLMAHVIPVETDRADAASHVAYLRRVFTCKQVAFARYASTAAPTCSLHDVADRSLTAEPLRITPAALEEHLRFQESAGRPHCAGPRSDVQTVGFVLDLPRPIPFDARGYRRSTCRHDPSCAALRDMTHHQTDADMQRMFPGVLVYKKGPRSAIYMTKRFLVHLVLSFYDVLNARATRRKLCELYAANSLASESALAWSATALPRCRALRGILLKALGSFLAVPVRHVRRADPGAGGRAGSGGVGESLPRRLHIYSGQIIRGDGNFDLAKRIGRKSGEGPFANIDYAVVLAWCGIDGCLLKPVAPAESEAWEDLCPDLGDVVTCLRGDRLRRGLSLREAAPVCRSTGMYGKHKALTEAYYHEMYSDLVSEVTAPTPKGDADGAPVQECAAPPTLAVGEPVHDVTNVRKAASPASNDCSDFIIDWADMVARLSEKSAAEAEGASGPVRGGLRDPAEGLLREAILHPAALVRRSVASADQDTLAEVRSFLAEARLDRSPLWRRMFNARPPRGTLQRICRRLGTRLHPTLQRRNYVDQKEFRREARAIKRWHKPGRKLTRRRAGMLRSRRAVLRGGRARGLRTVWTQKVQLHYRRFLQPKRQEGLWRWREVALALHAAGIPVHSGAIPVERLWASMLDMFLSSARLMSRAWFDVLAALALLRCNYRHFHVRLLRTWAEADSLLAERVDNLSTAAHALSMWAEPEEDSADALPDKVREIHAATCALRPLFKPFSEDVAPVAAAPG
ncbi:unnamed protein product, partial [Prorocentrum cordatum]